MAYLYNTQITDAGMKELAGMKLKYLDPPLAAYTDLGLKHFLAATEPHKNLDLRSWKLTDAGLKELSGLKNFKYCRFRRARSRTRD